MTHPQHPNPEQLEDLLVARATQGLDAQEQQQYDQLAAHDPAIVQQAEAFELTTASAAVALTHHAGVSALPAELRQRLLQDAGRHLPPTAHGLKLAGTPAASASPANPPARSGLQAIGWYVAAAALIGLAFVLFMPGPSDPPETTPAQQYATLASQPATVAATWGFNPDGGEPRFANATGEVIFNPDQQAGYMKLTGLPVNDPTKEQYQLWIVDASRTGQTTDRVDGGVFDVTDAGEVIIPIDAAIRADQPVVFAITVEKPGGVVVSKGPLQMVAAVPSE